MFLVQLLVSEQAVDSEIALIFTTAVIQQKATESPQPEFISPNGRTSNNYDIKLKFYSCH